MRTKKLLLSLGTAMVLTACSSEVPCPVPENRTETTMVNPYRISIQEALESAARVRKEIYGEPTRNNALSVESIQTITSHATRSNAPDTLYYIVNYADNNGFAVLSADSRIDEVQAIADEGSLSMSDTISNKGLAIFFENLNSQYNSIEFEIVNPAVPNNPKDTTIQLIPNPITETYTVKPILHTKIREWHQRDPFNSMCPQNCPVGCMALSLGQILSFYEWPTTINGTTYDWNVIKSTHGSQTFQLLATLGSSAYLNLNYRETGTGVPSFEAWDYHLKPTLKKLGYPNVKKYDFTTNSVSSIIRAKEPVLIHSTRHAWVMDGYYYQKESRQGPTGETTVTIKELFHCVWGWGKKSDGYFAWNGTYIGGVNPQKQESGEISEAPIEFYELVYFSNFSHNQ